MLEHWHNLAESEVIKYSEISVYKTKKIKNYIYQAKEKVKWWLIFRSIFYFYNEKLGDWDENKKNIVVIDNSQMRRGQHDKIKKTGKELCH